LCLAAPFARAAEPPAPTTILGAGSYWREHVTRAAPLASGPGEPADRAVAPKGRRARIILGPSAPLPADWTKPAFDDKAWARTRGPFQGRHEFGRVCRRGTFLVTRPADVRKLTLEMTYCGGAAVYLNGREVHRASLPPGPLSEATPGKDYPKAAFFVSDGPRKGKLLHGYTDRKRKEQFALRWRTAGPVDLPVDALRKGANVLAVELHRSCYPPECREAGAGSFAPIALGRLFLKAEAEPGAVAQAVARPQGFQVWNADIIEEVTELDFGPPCEPLRPVRIAAVQNGTFSGQVVVGSTAAIVGLRAEMGRLSRTDGGKSIPVDAVRVRYARPGQKMAYLGGRVFGGRTGVSLGVHFRRFDGLVHRLPAKIDPTAPSERLNAKLRQALGLPDRPVPAAVVPVWITVDVPRDTAPGTCKGTLTIRADGQKDRAVAVELEVFDWTLPDVRNYVSEFSVYQSPDTLAAYYKVPLWSEKHWSLIEQSVRLIGEAGNHTIIVPLLSKEQGGNAESYVTWVRQPDGSFTYDTALMERYVDLYLEHHAREQIDVVCLTVWGNAGVAAGNPYQKQKYDERGLPTKTRGTFTVTALDPKTGTKSDMELPPPGTKEYADFWRPVLREVRRKLAERKLADRIALGMPADPPIPIPVVRIFHDVLPDAGWFVGNHPGKRGYRCDPADRRKLVSATHVERVYTGPLPDPAKKRHRGWQRKQMCLAFNRYGFGPLCLYPNPRVWAFRMLMEADLASGHRGAGRIGADYWRMPDVRSRSGGAGTFYMRYPQSSVGQTGMAANCAALLAPGPAGPVSSVRFENVREGIQNAEAAVFLQKALLAKTLPEKLAGRCRRALDARIHAMRTYTLGLGHAGWQQRDRTLYGLAAEVAAHKQTP
jgi:hypothetical protein